MASVTALRTAIAHAVTGSQWNDVPPLVDQLAAADWRPTCPTCATALTWERDMEDPGEQWLWCDTCSASCMADQFHALATGDVAR